MIGIIDYGMGNLGSVTNACAFLELNARVVAVPGEIECCTGLILPGVGGFSDCMRHLSDHGFVEPVRDWIREDRPFLGICLGLQVLFDDSEEAPGTPGLGVFPGTVRRFPGGEGLKVPQIGWNRVQQVQADCSLFDGIDDGTFFYFVHSYYVDPKQPDLTAGATEYGITYTSAVSRGRVGAVQYHPEKSQRHGLRLLRNFSTSIETPRNGSVP